MRKPTDQPRDEAWYRQPILWLGVLVFAASLAGCIWIIQVSLQHDEAPTHHAARTILGVPASGGSSASP